MMSHHYTRLVHWCIVCSLSDPVLVWAYFPKSKEAEASDEAIDVYFDILSFVWIIASRFWNVNEMCPCIDRNARPNNNQL